MKQPGFFEGVMVALVMSLLGGLLFSVLSPIFGTAEVLRWLIVGMSFGYLIYLLSRSNQSVGRVTVILGWVLLTGMIGLSGISLTLYLLLHLLLIWLIRSLYFYASLFSAVLDLGLNGLSLAAGVWAFDHTGSLFLGIWCLFLIQALFVAIPVRIPGKTAEASLQQLSEERFEQAHRTAQTALNKLSSNH